ncbi:hypothetical protein SNE26_24365 [Mucilaginibacter sp. cycad4]|uniref:hypothetical protein n=1 Tax=Mucilaginibacter sp. cycad4 TaxID=3342096 RepID=UPI002AAA8EFF|nr:hypothetical protein [Mucilaginibacter gossypii]WPU99151.1 hypothetical protein SNE26_24365 [Mucilaginibacter gossypii]
MNTDFADIKPALSEVIQESKGIIKKFQQLFLVIKFQPEPEKCNLIVKQLDDYFARVQLRSWHKLTRNVNLLTYFQYGENKVYLSSIFLKEISNIYGMSHVDELLGIQQSVTPACAAIKYKLRRQINQ